MKITKNKWTIGAAIVVAAIILWAVFKPAPAEAAKMEVYGSLNYMISNNENA